MKIKNKLKVNDYEEIYRYGLINNDYESILNSIYEIDLSYVFDTNKDFFEGNFKGFTYFKNWKLQYNLCNMRENIVKESEKDIIKTCEFFLIELNKDCIFSAKLLSEIFINKNIDKKYIINYIINNSQYYKITALLIRAEWLFEKMNIYLVKI
jgi:hypothetical protein